MGIYSRDYIRDTRPGDPYGSAGGDWAIKSLLIANVIVFFLQNTIPALTELLSLARSDLVPGGQVWRLVTYGFCHSPSDLMHILFNMFVLWMFGRMIEPIYGSREFLAFYLGGVLAAGVCHVGVQAIDGASNPVVGASGGVMAVVFLTAMHYPRMKVLVMFVLPVELRWLAVFYALADVAGAFDPQTNVAHAAHLGGAAFGIAYRYFHWRLTGSWNQVQGKLRQWMKRRDRPQVRLYEPSKHELDQQVDAILTKIYKQGEESLTDQERDILKNASRRYRNPS